MIQAFSPIPPIGLAPRRPFQATPASNVPPAAPLPVGSSGPAFSMLPALAFRGRFFHTLPNGEIHSTDKTFAQDLVRFLNMSYVRDMIVVGRMPERCDLILPDSTVSRTHAGFFREDDAVFVRDMGTYYPGGPQYPGSLNGTWWVDGTQLIPMPVDIRRLEAARPVGTPSPPQRLHNGDYIFIQGHILPIDGLIGDKVDAPLVIGTVREASQELSNLKAKLQGHLLNERQRKNEILLQGRSDRQFINAPDLMQARLLLNQSVRFSMYYKLRQLNVPHEQVMNVIDRLKELAARIMVECDGELNLPEGQKAQESLLRQSIVSLKEVKQELKPEGDLFKQSFADLSLSSSSPEGPPAPANPEDGGPQPPASPESDDPKPPKKPS